MECKNVCLGVILDHEVVRCGSLPEMWHDMPNIWKDVGNPIMTLCADNLNSLSIRCHIYMMIREERDLI